MWGGVIVWVGVGMSVWVRKGVYGWDSLDCCRKVCVCRGVGREGREMGRGECGCGCNCVGGGGCDCMGEKGSVWVGQP